MMDVKVSKDKHISRCERTSSMSNEIESKTVHEGEEGDR